MNVYIITVMLPMQLEKSSLKCMTKADVMQVSSQLFGKKLTLNFNYGVYVKLVTFLNGSFYMKK